VNFNGTAVGLDAHTLSIVEHAVDEQIRRRRATRCAPVPSPAAEESALKSSGLLPPMVIANWSFFWMRVSKFICALFILLVAVVSERSFR